MLSRKQRTVKPTKLTVCQYILNGVYYYNKYTYDKSSNVVLLHRKTNQKYNIYNFEVFPLANHWEFQMLVTDHNKSVVIVSAYEDDSSLSNGDTFVDEMEYKRFNPNNFYKPTSDIFRVPAEQMLGVFNKVKDKVSFKEHFILRVQQRAGNNLIDVFETIEYIIDTFVTTGIEGLNTKGKAFHFDNSNQIFVLAYNPLFKTLIFITYYHQNQQNNDDFKKYKKGVRFNAKRGFDTSNRNKTDKKTMS